MQVPVVIILHTARSQASAELAGQLEALAQEHGGRFQLARVDIDAAPEVAQALQATSVPTVVALIGGQPVPMLQGAIPVDQLRGLLDQLLELAARNGVTGRLAPPDANTEPVEPEETEALRAEDGKDLLTLVTCTPLGINTHRILLTGERIYPTPAKDVAAAGKRPDVPSFPWWAVALVAGLIVVGLYLWRSGYAAARAKERALARARSAQEEPRPQTWAEQMRIWMDDDAGVEPRRWFTDLPIPPQPSEAENVELLEEIASLSASSGRWDDQELIDTAEIPVLDATRPSAGASGRTHSL